MKITHKGMIGFGILVGFFLLYFLSPVLTPFFIAVLIAYLADPIVNVIKRLGIPRTWAVVFVFTLLFILLTLAIFLLVPMLVRQTGILINRLPDLLNWVQNVALPWLYEHVGIAQTFNLQDVKLAATKHWKEAGNLAMFTWKAVSYSGEVLLIWMLNLLLVLVVTFYLLRDWDHMWYEARKLLPRSIEPLVINLIGECNATLAAFFRGQLLVMLAVGVFYSIGLWLIGIDLALLLGISAGILTIVPYLGFIMGLVGSSIAAFVEFHDMIHVGYVFIVFFVGHLVEGMWLTPWLVGDRIGLHPVAVIFAILVGGKLFGFMGVLLALPVAAIILVLLRYVKQRYINSALYNVSEY